MLYLLIGVSRNRLYNLLMDRNYSFFIYYSADLYNNGSVNGVTLHEVNMHVYVYRNNFNSYSWITPRKL